VLLRQLIRGILWVARECCRLRSGRSGT
jgi:hypothetical protein